jgi:hypothetical protein
MERLAGAFKNLAAAACTDDTTTTDSFAAEKLPALVTQVYEKIAHGLAQQATGNTISAVA